MTIKKLKQTISKFSNIECGNASISIEEDYIIIASAKCDYFTSMKFLSEIEFLCDSFGYISVLKEAGVLEIWKK